MKQQPKSIPVVSAILFTKEDNELRVFIQTRWKPKASPTYSGMIEIPAGGIDSYENVYDALKREVKEEIGVDIEIISDLSYYEDIVDSVHGIYFGYVGKILKGKPEILEPEKCDGLEWFNPNQLPEKTSDHTRVYIKRYQSSL